MEILVFGSINMDVVANCEHLPRPGETVLGNHLAYLPGGKGANQAIAAARSGGKVRMLGAIGQDAFGQTLLDFLKLNNVAIDDVASLAEASTGVALVAVSAKGENNIVVVPGANSQARSLIDSVPKSAIVISQFETPLDQIHLLFSRVRANGGVTILNPSPYQIVESDLVALCSFIIVNETEFSQLIGLPETENVNEIEDRLRKLRDFYQGVIVTLGKSGFVMRYKDQIFHAPGYVVDVVDTTGAGDCFAGTFAAELSKGNSPFESACKANVAAALSVTKQGAAPAMPTNKEIDFFLDQPHSR